MINIIDFNMVQPRQILYGISHARYLFSLFGYPLRSVVSSEASILQKARQRFERIFFERTGLRQAIPLSKGRTGLYLLLKHLGKQSHANEVILSPFTIFDVVNMVINAGKKPVFVDSISRQTPHLSLEAIKKNHTDSTVAVLITHYATPNPEIQQIAQFCKAKGIFLVEDCAISLGTFVSGSHVGSFGDAAFFSFGLFKFISVYYGGCLILNNGASYLRNVIINNLTMWSPLPMASMLDYAWKGLKMSILTSNLIFPIVFQLYRYGFNKKIRWITDSAKNDPHPFLSGELPSSYKHSANQFQLSEYSRQLPKSFFDLRHRQRIYSLYLELLGHLNWLNDYSSDVSPSNINFPVVASTLEEKRRLISHLMNHGFDVGEYFYRSCNTLKVFADYHVSCPNLEHFSECVVTLPTHPRVSTQYAHALATCVNRFYAS